MKLKRKPPWKRNAAWPKKRIKVRQPAENDAPVEPIIVKSPGRRLDRSLKP